MGTASTAHWDSVGQWSPTLFLIGGGLLVGHAALLGVRAFSDLATPPDVLGPAGHFVALVGLLGLYPALRDRTPRLAGVAGAVAAVAVVSWAVLTVTRVLGVVGVVSAGSDVLPAPVVALAFVSTVVTYGLFGAATLRVDDSSPVVGGLVFAPGVLIVTVFVDSALTGVTAADGFVVGSGLALSVLALGYTLRTWGCPGAQPVPAGDTTAG